MKSRFAFFVGVALFVLILAGGCAVVKDPLEDLENNKLTADIGPEMVPAEADRGLLMVDNSNPADEVAPTALTKLVTAPAASKAYGASANLSVPYYAQETSYWCGPASAKMIQYYFNMGCTNSPAGSTLRP